MSQVRIDIKGREWTFMLLPDKRFDKLHPRDDGGSNVAMTVFANYEVHFKKSTWDLITIRHEIFHILYAAGLTSSATLSNDDVEEISAEIVGHHTPEIILWSDRIAEKFLGRE